LEAACDDVKLGEQSKEEILDYFDNAKLTLFQSGDFEQSSSRPEQDAANLD
jgi:hypothetical protein